ncbi:TPR repeat-containing thioredoxin TTL1 [Acorus gramineus]|uniref:TPR repeat-containing thioredoxin TTL1 n=1 Tax=Acorus gramineus TaxID=55184 RepID=A0AAV9BHG7_ACOGR|nr:TPR repeat-containing thioredoxin TTL1 [Acorus gramineus]
MSVSEGKSPSNKRPIDPLLPTRFGSSLTLETDKPDFKELDLGSPVSPLRTRLSAAPATSSSSSSSGSAAAARANTHPLRRSDGGGALRSHSGELSGSSDDSSGSGGRRPGHGRSHSGPLIYSGGGGGGGGSSSTASSPALNVLPAGNICPSGKIGKTGMAIQRSSRSDVLGTGTVNYGHGSIMRGGGSLKMATDAGMANGRGPVRVDPEELRRAGNERYKRGNFAEALRLYDRALEISPGNAACRSNRAAALTGLGRLAEAVGECEEAVRLDPMYLRAYQRLGSLYVRLGDLEKARKHLYFGGQQPDPRELQKLHTAERHLNRCETARKVEDWKSTLRETDAAIEAGADASPLLFACKAEALLRLHQLEEAESALPSPLFSPTSPNKFCGMLCDSYLYFVRAQVEKALGRFESAVTAAEKASQLDTRNIEVTRMLNNVRSVARARSRGNDLFKAGLFEEACDAYGEGLRFDPSNSVLYCNRAACRSKLGQLEHSVDDCNEALRIQPNYTKALLRRAASNTKLERWAESVRDYEALRKVLPSDNEVAEALFHAQIALKKSRGEEVYNMKFGGEVEEISGVEQFHAAIATPGVSVVFFKLEMDQGCRRISPTVDALCVKYPFMNFLKVDIEESPTLAESEKVRFVPTFKIYKNGSRVKEIVNPIEPVLVSTVSHYSH